MRRVNEAVREVVSARIAEGLRDPRIGFVTVTSVDTSTDLRHARVYVSVLGDDEQRAATMAGLAPDERGRDLGALPEVVMIGLGHRRAEAALEVRLQRAQLPPLALQASVVGEVKLYLEETDEAQPSVCSTCLIS